MSENLFDRIPQWLKSLHEMENELRNAARKGLILRKEEASGHLAQARQHLETALNEAKGAEPANGPQTPLAQRGRGLTVQGAPTVPKPTDLTSKRPKPRRPFGALSGRTIPPRSLRPSASPSSSTRRTRPGPPSRNPAGKNRCERLSLELAHQQPMLAPAVIRARPGRYPYGLATSGSIRAARRARRPSLLPARAGWQEHIRRSNCLPRQISARRRRSRRCRWLHSASKSPFARFRPLERGRSQQVPARGRSIHQKGRVSLSRHSTLMMYSPSANKVHACGFVTLRQSCPVANNGHRTWTNLVHVQELINLDGLRWRRKLNSALPHCRGGFGSAWRRRTRRCLQTRAMLGLRGTNASD